MPKEMDEFLSSLEPEEPPAPEVVETPAPVEAEAGSPPPPPPESTPAPAPAEDDEPIPDDQKGILAALQAERAKRKDHKGRADKLEGELAAIRAELEAQRKAPPPPPPSAATPPPVIEPPRQIPNMAEDPEGYHQYISEQFLQLRLSNSEATLRATVPDADVDEKIAAFKRAADANPALGVELTRQQHPWKWAYDQGKRLLALAEVGDDPNAFRTKVRSEIEAEVRAKILAEMAEGVGVSTPAGPPVVQLPGSLSNARSTGGRVAAPTAPDWDEIWDKRKKA